MEEGAVTNPDALLEVLGDDGKPTGETLTRAVIHERRLAHYRTRVMVVCAGNVFAVRYAPTVPAVGGRLGLTVEDHIPADFSPELPDETRFRLRAVYALNAWLGLTVDLQGLELLMGVTRIERERAITYDAAFMCRVPDMNLALTPGILELAQGDVVRAEWVSAHTALRMTAREFGALFAVTGDNLELLRWLERAEA